MQKEQLSALMDGEFIDNELINTLSHDRVLQQRWLRYHLLRDALRGELTQTVPLDLADKISMAIAQEPTPLMSEDQPHPQQWSTLRFWYKIKPLFSTLSQAGIAASIAIAVIIGVQSYTTSTNQLLSTSPTFSSFAIGNMAIPVSYDVNTSAEHKLDHRRQFSLLQDYELQRRLHASSLQHNVASTENSASINNTNAN